MEKNGSGTVCILDERNECIACLTGSRVANVLHSLAVAWLLCILLMAGICGQIQVVQAQPAMLPPEDALSLPFWSVGFYGHGTANFHSADFPASVSQSGAAATHCCGAFRSGFGLGASIGALVEFPIVVDSRTPQFLRDAFEHRVLIALRGGYANHSGVLSALHDTLFMVHGQLVAGTVQHRLEAQLSSFGGEAVLHYRFGTEPEHRRTIALHALLGVRLGVFSERRYSQSRALQEPTNTARWANGLTEQVIVSDAAIPGMNTLYLDASVLVGVQAVLPIDRNGIISVVPEIYYAHPLSDIVPNRGWLHSRLSVGAILKISFLPSSSPPSAPPQSEPLPQPPVPLAAARQPDVLPTAPSPTVLLKAIVVDSSGGTALPSHAIKIRVEEFTSRRVFPLLMNVFFDERSDQLAERYKLLRSPAEAAQFRTADVARRQALSTLEIYYNVLNIIGERMRSKPASTITVTGCLGSVGFGPDSEENDPELARRRAESVRNYLRDVWQIDTMRIKVVARGLPEQPSRTTDALSMGLNIDEEENRRVEVSSDDWDIIKPVLDDDTVRVSTFPTVRIQAEVKSIATMQQSAQQSTRQDRRNNPSARWLLLKSWIVQVRQGSRVLARFRGGESFFAPEWTVLWNVEQSPPESDTPVVIALNGETADGQRVQAFDTLQVEYVSIQKKRFERLADKEYSAFRLIGFDLGSAAATARHKRILNEYMRPLLGRQAVVKITGHSDAIGNEQANIRLSRARAESIAQAIGTGNRTVEGIGGKGLLYPNDTPEGRMYSRTVEIQVVNPIQR